MKPFMVVDKAKGEVARAAHGTTASPWLEGLARFGYAVRGVLYATVGVLAVEVAIGRGGAVTDKDGAIGTIGGEPFGKLLLVLVVAGLAGYALWGFVRALLDPLGRGHDAKGLAQRIGYAISGLSYAALVPATVNLLLGHAQAKAGSGPQNLTAGLLAQPFGAWVVGLIGVIAAAGGLGQFYQAFSGSFQKDFKAWEMPAATFERTVWLARFGIAARGVIFVMGGFFLIQAAREANPKEAKGLDGTLQTLAHQPFGPWLLGLVALGLVAFGCYSLVCARWIRIRPGR